MKTTTFAEIRRQHAIPGTRHLLVAVHGSEGNCCRRCGNFHDPSQGLDLAEELVCFRSPIRNANGERRWWPQGKALSK